MGRGVMGKGVMGRGSWVGDMGRALGVGGHG